MDLTVLLSTSSSSSFIMELHSSKWPSFQNVKSGRSVFQNNSKCLHYVHIIHVYIRVHLFPLKLILQYFLFLLRFSCVALLSLFCSWETSSLRLVLFTTNTWIRTKLKLYKWPPQRHGALYQSNLRFIWMFFLNVSVYAILC